MKGQNIAIRFKKHLEDAPLSKPYFRLVLLTVCYYEGSRKLIDVFDQIQATKQSDISIIQYAYMTHTTDEKDFCRQVQRLENYLYCFEKALKTSSFLPNN